MKYIIVGSTAIKTAIPTFREPKDTDIITNPNISNEEHNELLKVFDIQHPKGMFEYVFTNKLYNEDTLIANYEVCISHMILIYISPAHAIRTRSLIKIAKDLIWLKKKGLLKYDKELIKIFIKEYNLNTTLQEVEDKIENIETTKCIPFCWDEINKIYEGDN